MLGEEVVITADEKREENLDYCRDFFNDFVELAESYVPDIVTEFVERFPWKHKSWLKNGASVKMGGGF